jgi:flagellar hook-associated protein 2
LVESFNSVLGTLGQLTAYNADSGETGLLFGDSVARGVASQLRRELSEEVASAVDDFDTLTDIGITTGEDGSLVLDGAVLEGALRDDMDAVAQLFAADDGYVARLGAVLAGYADDNGVIDSRIDGLNGRIDGIEEQRQDLARRMESLESRLLQQFIAMDEVVAQLRSTSDFLTQQLESLPSLTSQK